MSKWDPILYIFRREEGFIILLLAVEEISVSTNDKKSSKSVKIYIAYNIICQDLCRFESILCWSITFSPIGIKMNQPSYSKGILTKFGLEHCNCIPTELTQNSGLLKRQDNDSRISENKQMAYISIIGSI